MENNNKHLNSPQVEAEQVKEKFGGLRFYINGGCEEIFGFILIVALIIVAGTLFLLLKKPVQAELKNDQVSNLLYSMIAYTSSYNNKQMYEVIEECHDCTDEVCESCNTAKNEMAAILEVSLKESNLVIGKQLKGYSLNASNSRQLFSIESGETAGNMIGSPVVIHTNTDDVIVTLRFFY